LSLIARLSMDIGIIPTDAAAGLNYGLDKVRFLAPVKAGAHVRLRVSLASVEPKEAGQLVMKTINVMEIEGAERPAFIAETLALIIPGKTPQPAG
jgi:acyl dehydratase